MTFYGTPLVVTPTIRVMSVGKRVRALRMAQGLKQGELARRAKVEQSTLSDLERGDTKQPRGDTLVSLAEALRVSHDWLMTGEGTPVQPVHPDIDESELLSIYRDLSETNRLGLLAAARAMLGSQPKPTAASPLKRAIKQKQ